MTRSTPTHIGPIDPSSLQSSYFSNPKADRRLNRADPVRVDWSAAEAAAASTTGVHAAITDTGSPVNVTTEITNPPAPRNLTATSGGTAGDIGAIQVTVTGTNEFDEEITEVLPIFTANSATTVVGNKAFKTVTNIAIPAHDGLGATTAIGFGDKLGLPLEATTISGIRATLGGVLEGTAPTYVADADEVDKNTVDLNSALSGAAVSVWFMYS